MDYLDLADGGMVKLSLMTAIAKNLDLQCLVAKKIVY